MRAALETFAVVAGLVLAAGAATAALIALEQLLVGRPDPYDPDMNEAPLGLDSSRGSDATALEGDAA